MVKKSILKEKHIDFVITLLIGVGAINWALSEVFNYNIVRFLSLISPVLEKITYFVIGVAGIVFLWDKFSK